MQRGEQEATDRVRAGLDPQMKRLRGARSATQALEDHLLTNESHDQMADRLLHGGEWGVAYADTENGREAWVVNANGFPLLATPLTNDGSAVGLVMYVSWFAPDRTRRSTAALQALLALHEASDDVTPGSEHPFGCSNCHRADDGSVSGRGWCQTVLTVIQPFTAGFPHRA